MDAYNDQKGKGRACSPNKSIKKKPAVCPECLQSRRIPILFAFRPYRIEKVNVSYIAAKHSTPGNERSFYQLSALVFNLREGKCLKHLHLPQFVKR